MFNWRRPLAAVLLVATATSHALPAKAPTANVTVFPATTELGKKARISWSSSNASDCIASGAWSGDRGTRGGEIEVTPAVGSYSYTLTCTGPNGSASDTATLKVTSSPASAPTLSLSVAPTSITLGNSATLSWTSGNADSCAAGGAWSGTQALSGSASETPAAAGNSTYTLSCTGKGGKVTQSATLVVNALPTVTISASPSSLTLGAASTLSWTSTNATSCTASGAWNGGEPTSGSAGVLPTALGANNYTLSCSGPGGTASGTATVVATTPLASLSLSVDSGATIDAVTINQGTAIGQGAGNGATPFTLSDLTSNPKTGSDPNNSQTITSSSNPFTSVGHVPDTAFGFCDYSGSAPKRVSYVTGAKFATTDPRVPMAPFYFPLVYNSPLTVSDNAGGSKAPIIGLFDWRPKDIDEALVAAESDDNGKTWYFMQTVLELFPDYSNPISGGYVAGSTNTGCPATVNSTNASNVAVNGSNADAGWGHASILQLPGVTGAAGQYLYMLDRSSAAVDVAPLWVINLTGASPKFPIWNSNSTAVGANDIKSISSAQTPTPGNTTPVIVKQTNGLLNPDGIMAVFPTAPSAAAGTPVTVMYVQKILSGDNTGATALPAAQQCKAAPFSGKTNHDISNVRLAQTIDGVNFTDLGVVNGLNDPTTVDYNKTRWISPRGTLIDINGDGSRWGLLFAGGNCLDGDSDSFHYIGYAESSDRVNWTVYNDINHPVASINTITTSNQATGVSVTIPSGTPLLPTQPWFAQRLYAPTAVQIDATHLSLTFAGYGVQSPNNNLLNYRQIGNAVLTTSVALPQGTPNNINAH